MPAPPAEALAAILSGRCHITRRCEIYEPDGETLWQPGITPRMTTGSVTVDYTRDERRNIDITLNNSDKQIDHNPDGGFWYDKILKVYRGVTYNSNGIDCAWETQLGEFLIDKIDEPRTPRTLHVTGRDYTKRLLTTNFDTAVSFDPGYPVDTLVAALATFGKVYKTKLNSGGATTDSTQTFDSSVTLWAAIKAICNSQNIEVFFDAYGYLVTRPYFDPSTSPTTLTLKTGDPDGNLVDYQKSSDDSQLYNRIVVSGTSPDSANTGQIFQGIAENHEPSSPTSIENLNQVRSYYYSSSFFTSDQQCQNYANSLLSYHALEAFTVSYNSIVFAWLEAGEIVKMILPNAAPGEPTRYLNTGFTIPLTLDTMSGTANRITIVGSTFGL